MLDELATNISELAELRGLAEYGCEKGLDVDYFKDYTSIAYEKARKHYECCAKLIFELYSVTLTTVSSNISFISTEKGS